MNQNSESAKSESPWAERGNEISRLKWQCRRGMRELDELLLGYLEHRYLQAPPQDKQAFRALLQLSDPELMGYLLQKDQAAADLERVVEHILDRTQT